MLWEIQRFDLHISISILWLRIPPLSFNLTKYQQSLCLQWKLQQVVYGEIYYGLSTHHNFCSQRALWSVSCQESSWSKSHDWYVLITNRIQKKNFFWLMSFRPTICANQTWSSCKHSSSHFFLWQSTQFIYHCSSTPSPVMGFWWG